MNLFKMIKNIFIIPGAIVYFAYIFIVAVREQIKNGGWSYDQYTEFTTRIAVHVHNHIEEIEWLSFVIWCGFFIYIFEKNYARWIF